MVAAVVLVALMASVGAAYAYSVTTVTDDTDLSVNHVSAVNSNGGSYIQVPAVSFSSNGSTYVPSQEAGTTSGTLTLASADAEPKIRAWVEFQNALSWTAIKTLTVTIDGTEHECFNAATATGSLQTCLPTEAVSLTAGEHSFSITVVYKTGMDVDPSSYTGSNMKSRIVFLMDGDDPLS